MKIKTQLIETIASKAIHKITLVNDFGIEASFLTLGATWQEFLVPRANGGKKNLIIGFDQPSTYLTNGLCAGQSIGRVAGRIDSGRFEIDGKVFSVPQNEKGNCLHGGNQGFHKQVWDYDVEESKDKVTLIMTYEPKEALDGFPGDMKVEVRFSLDNANCLTITYKGSQASQPTLFNPTNHVYVNLSDRQDLTSHHLTLAADAYLETRDDLIPTGKQVDPTGTAYDFRNGQNLGQSLMKIGGYDDAFVVSPNMESPLGILKDQDSGDQLALYSDRNAWVIYTMGGISDGIFPSRDKGRAAKEFEAVALEAQFLPDAINHQGFGDIVLRPGQEKIYHIAFEYRSSI
ncbi:MAG: aldose epimerase family protein [Streptococcus orisratti]|nr:aldose epimerase family protein [Streptococcus orisratti]